MLRSARSEVIVYHDDAAVYFEHRGKDSGIVPFSFEILETLKRVVEEEAQGQEERREDLPLAANKGNE